MAGARPALSPLFTRVYNGPNFFGFSIATLIPVPIIPRMALKPFKPELPFGHPIKVYRNIRTGLWSVMDAKTGKVVGCTDSLVVANAKFQVSAKGIQRIRETRRKRVVAFVVGSFVSYAWDESCQDSVRFNPYEFDFFVDAHGSPVKVADAVNLTPLGWVWARNARVWPPYKP